MNSGKTPPLTRVAQQNLKAVVFLYPMQTEQMSTLKLCIQSFGAWAEGSSTSAGPCMTNFMSAMDFYCPLNKNL